MRAVFRQFLLMGAALFGQAALAQDKPLFGAPQAAGANDVGASGSIGQVTIALVIVLAVVFAAAWALKQARRLNLTGNVRAPQIVGQVALGAKERAVLIQVNDVQVLVGVAPGQVTALHVFTDIAVETPPAVTAEQSPAAAPSFKTLLKKSLGMR